MMELDDLIEKVKEVAAESKGRSNTPGMARFMRITGFSPYNWEKYGLKWSTVVERAGFAPNGFAAKLYDDDEILRRYAEFVLDLGHLPRQRELLGKRTMDHSFPSGRVFDRFGARRELLERVAQYCRGRRRFRPVLQICVAALASVPMRPRRKKFAGCVYLVQVRQYYKIGKTAQVWRRIAVIKSYHPRSARLLHIILTDDPDGLERYWHKRFQNKKVKGEWFRLKQGDVEAFKQWTQLP